MGGIVDRTLDHLVKVRILVPQFPFLSIWEIAYAATIMFRKFCDHMREIASSLRSS